MSFGWPLALLGLLALPALATAYIWKLRRRRRQAVPYSSIALIRAAGPQRSAWRRHLPFALVLGALAALTVAGARPQVRADVPVSGSAVIVALDVSGSMCATDVTPNRLSAAQAAVRAFITAQDDDTQIGLVVFSGFAQVAVSPTTDRESLVQAVDTLTTGRGTTIGAAILKSIDAIAAIDPDVAPAGTDGLLDQNGAPPSPVPNASPSGPADPSDPSDPSDPAGPSDPSDPAGPSDPARPVPEIVVLLTDGANTRGISPQEAAVQAAARGVRIYPIGFGTTNPTSMVCTSEQLGGTMFEGFGRGQFGGQGRGRNFLVADDDALRQVAATTGGEFFKAEDADQLQGVLKDLPRHVQVQQKDIEASVGLVGLGVLLVLLAVGTAARWSAFPR